MAKSIDNTAAVRGHYSDALGLYFPALWRVEWVNIDPAMASELTQSLGFEVGFDRNVIYTINPDLKVIGNAERRIVTHILEDEGPSVVIRHHRSDHAQDAYIYGVTDAGIDVLIHTETVRTPYGIFTLLRRSSPAGENAPFVFHCGWYSSADPFLGESPWESRTDRNGVVIIGQDLLYPDEDDEE